MPHSCPLCREEAIPERCPLYTPDLSWGKEDSEAVTNPDGLGAWMGLGEALTYLREVLSRSHPSEVEQGIPPRGERLISPTR